MKFSAVAFALAAAVGVSASYSGNATVVTEVVDVYTTYCPGPTELTYGTKTYTVTKATTLVITDCPCTVVKPVMTTSAVVCHTCGGYSNSTMNPVSTAAPTVASPVVPTGSMVPTGAPSSVPTAGAGKAAALSGAGLLGLVGLAALL